MMTTATLPQTKRPARKAGKPGIATTYEGQDGALLDAILPLVDYIEITPDVLRDGPMHECRLHPARLAEIKRAAEHVPLLIHGVGLSIGSIEGMNQPYIRLLEKLVDQFPCYWNSEHLGFTTVDGNYIGSMLSMPRTEEALNLICERIDWLTGHFKMPFLIENVASVLADPPADYSDAGFLNEIARRTGCGLILDVYNLECDEHNHGLNIPAFFDELNMSAVREIHTARGTEQNGFLLDVHSRRLMPRTIELAQEVVARAEGAVEVVTYELLSQAVASVGIDGICAELQQLNELFA